MPKDEHTGVANRQQVETSGIFLEPASGIEPPTCGLRIRPEQILKRSVYQWFPRFKCENRHLHAFYCFDGFEGYRWVLKIFSTNLAQQSVVTPLP